MERRIALSKKNKETIAKLFGVSVRTVFNALNVEKSDNDLHKRIRKAAIEHGGIEMLTVPSIETFHDSDNIMRQRLLNGALIEISKVDGTGRILFRGKEVAHYANVMFSQIPEIQQRAASLR